MLYSDSFTEKIDTSKYKITEEDGEMFNIPKYSDKNLENH